MRDNLCRILRDYFQSFDNLKRCGIIRRAKFLDEVWYDVLLSLATHVSQHPGILASSQFYHQGLIIMESISPYYRNVQKWKRE